MAPGQTFSDEVIVTNTGDNPIELAVSGVDGVTAPTSGAVYGNRQTVAPHAELGARLGKPGLSVALSGPNGYQRAVVRTLDTILPGDTIPYHLAWPDVLQPGEYSITVTATAPGGAAPVVHQASSKLGTPLAGVPAPGVVTPAPASESRGGYPVMWVVVVLVAAAGVGGGLYLGRRGPKAPAEGGRLGVLPRPLARGLTDAAAIGRVETDGAGVAGSDGGGCRPPDGGGGGA